jgi:acyl-CoA hydrolase
VALDSNSKPKKVDELTPETAAEKEQYDGAMRRRQMRLVLAGKLKPSEASELKNLFA